MIAVGLVLLAQGPMMSDYLRDLLLPMALLGVGGGLAFPALTILAMADATPGDSGACLWYAQHHKPGWRGARPGDPCDAFVQSHRPIARRWQHTAAALSGGYHFAWAIGAGLTLVAIVLAATVLKSDAIIGDCFERSESRRVRRVGGKRAG